MLDLEQRLQRLAAQGERLATAPGPEAAIRRGRRRRLHLTAGAALFTTGMTLAVVLGSTALRSPAPPPAAQAGRAEAVAPYRIGASVRCPLGWPVVAMSNKASYPPGYPAPAPHGSTVVACYSTVAQAAAAGYPPASPPAGVLEVGGVYLVPTSGQLRRQCQQAADRLGFAVPCPLLLPTPSANSAPPRLCGQRFPCRPGFGFVLEESGFTVPPGYIGADTASGARLVIAAATQPTASPVICDVVPGATGVTVTVRGTQGSLFECRPQGSVHFGSVLVRWRERGVVMVVSLHGHTELNQRLAIALATHLKPVPPSK